MQKLKRSLGLLETTFYGVGVIVGAGIYALIGKAAGLAGNMVWAAFGIGALIAAFTGLSYAELSSMFPKAGGEYVYLEHAFSRRLAFLVGWLIVFGGVVTAATVALGFSGYFSAIFHTPLIPIALVLIVLLSLLNFWGMRESAIANIIATIVELAGLALIIFFGLKYFGSVDYLTLPSFGFTGILSATALIFFAYLPHSYCQS
jgi:basic amino acid/polyamine antiporter, APA family